MSFHTSRSANDLVSLDVPVRELGYGGFSPANLSYRSVSSIKEEYATQPLRRSMDVQLLASKSSPDERDLHRGEDEAPHFQRISIDQKEYEPAPEVPDVAAGLQKCMELREKWIHCGGVEKRDWEYTLSKIGPAPPEPDAMPQFPDHCFQMVNGVFIAYETPKDMEDDNAMFLPHDLRTYYRDLSSLHDLVSNGPAKTFAFGRLKFLEAQYNMHVMLNEGRELATQRTIPHRDFYNVRKVDTHVHHSSSMNQKHLLKFIKTKLKTCPDEVVIFRDGKDLTLQQVFESLGLTAYQLSVDTLDVHADKNTFHRFDKFNLKYNPCGQSRLREIFLKTDNKVKGRYLAEITKQLFADLEASKYQLAEYRVSIYGRKPDEWSKLAAWIVDNELMSENNRWLIQIPRLYSVYRKLEIPTISSFKDMLDNIFRPLFRVTIDPSSDPKLHHMLHQVVGFDCVDDESKTEKRVHKHFPVPALWNTQDNPPYSYYVYYLWANICSLNVLRKQRGYRTFVFRPHAGEAGDVAHLAASYLCADGISHGILLRKAPVLKYLYYLSQVGIAMSPLSNNSLFLDYHRNPFNSFFATGLNVSLSTDDPLQFHFTKEPLIEEYSIAAQVWKLSPVDLCEIARNSVMQSGFEAPLKRRWFGDYFAIPGPKGNNIKHTNVPSVRVTFRYETLLNEINLLMLMAERVGGSTTYFQRHLKEALAIDEYTLHPVYEGSSQHGVAATSPSPPPKQMISRERSLSSSKGRVRIAEEEETKSK